MTFLQVLNEFLKENPNYDDFVFKVETKEEARALVKSLYKLGFYFKKNEAYSDAEVDSRWSQKKKDTCISIGALSSNDKNQLFHGRTGMYTKHGRMVVDTKTLFEETDETIQDVLNSSIKNSVKLCPNCNNEVSVKAKFCTKCGYKFDTTSIPENTETTSEKELPAEEVPFIKQVPTETTSTKPLITSGSPLLSLAQNMEIRENKKPENNPPDAQIPDEYKTVVFDVNDTDNNSTYTPHNIEVNNQENEKEVKRFSLLNDSDINKNIKTKSSELEVPELCAVLNVSVNQPFIIKNDFYDSNNKIFRINEKGIREEKVGANLWFVANNEQELCYIIENKNQIIRI